MMTYISTNLLTVEIEPGPIPTGAVWVDREDDDESPRLYYALTPDVFAWLMAKLRRLDDVMEKGVGGNGISESVQREMAERSAVLSTWWRQASRADQDEARRLLGEAVAGKMPMLPQPIENRSMVVRFGELVS